MLSIGRATGWTALSPKSAIQRHKAAATKRDNSIAGRHTAGQRMSPESNVHQFASVFHSNPGVGVVSLRKSVKVGSAADSILPGEPDNLDKETVGDLEAGNQEPNASLVPVLVAVCVAAMGAFLFGYHLGVVNGPLEQIAADLNFAGNTVLQGSVVSTLLAGAAVGALSGGGLADALGRRMALIANTVLLISGALLCANANSLNGMLFGRLIAGVGIGVSSGVVPLYISEIAPTGIRGALGSVNQLVICIGILVALLVNVALDPTAWPLMFTMAAIPAVILAVGMFFCPESPRWLAGRGETAKAQEIMVNLWGKAEPIKDNKTESTSAPSITSPKNLRILATGCALLLFQQFSGINAIVYFSSKVFLDAGLTSGALASAAVGATNVMGTVLATGLMDRAGRKQLLTYSYLGMGLAMLAMAAGFAIPALSKFSGPIALIGTLAYIMSFGLGVGPVPALIVPEISPAEIRGTAVSCAMTTHWVANFGIGQLFLPALATFGVSKVYVFFSAVCFAAIAFTSKYLVETKGKSLEEIAKEMSA